MTGPASGGVAAAGGYLPFMDALRACVGQRQADGRSMAILVIDCGLIGRIDAVWGYPVGDAVRERIADTLHADVLRPGDFVGPVGRDHLACVLATVDDPAVPLLAADKSLRALNVPLWVGDEEIFTEAVIGVAMFPVHGDEADILLQRARCACDAARGTTARVAEYSEPQHREVAQALITENRLRTAVKEDAVEVAFQPQYDLQMGPIMGAQIHLGWRDPAAGAISAARAFAAAESAGVVGGLVSSILNRVLRNISEFRYSAGLDLRVYVQLPARALLQPDLPEVIQRALGTWSLRAGRLVLQIGNTALLRVEPQAREALLQLKKIGVRLGIDDPALAVPSLVFLASLPFQEIRLDVSAMNAPAMGAGGEVPGMDAGAAPRASRSEGILRALIELSHHLALDVTACGVADAAGEARLKELGCDFMQAEFKGPALDPKGFVARFG